jgi:hypothetical protein
LPVSPPDRPDQAPSPPQPRSELTNEATTPATTTPRHQHAPKTGPGPVMSRPLQYYRGAGTQLEHQATGMSDPDVNRPH